MNEKTDGKKAERKLQRCLIWGAVPVFGFFALWCMADNSGEEKYRKLGNLFFIMTMTFLGIAVSGDMIIYFVSLHFGMMAAAYARSLVIVAWITLGVIYPAELIKILTCRKEYLKICAYKESVLESTGTGASLDEDEKTDLNTCTKEELLSLPGIDAALAVRIINDREERGGFDSVDELIDTYRIKPHFAAAILERAFVSRTERDLSDGERPFRHEARPVRAIDI